METNISIPIEDYAEYCQLLKARQVIVSILEDRGGISVPLLLTILGGAKAINLYKKMNRKEKDGEIEE